MNGTFKYLSLLALLIAAYFSEGYHHLDEHFQIIEFANWKSGNISSDDLPWEFAERMRPCLQPTMAYATMQIGEAVGINSPFIITFLLRLLSALLAWTVLLRSKVLYREFKNQPKRVLFWGLMLWFIFYNGVRFSSENWAGAFFALSLFTLIDPERQQWKDYLLAGIFMGLSFQFRYQMGFAILGLGLCLLIVQRTSIQRLAMMGLSFITVSLVAYLIDSWFYGESAFAAYNYLDQNIFHDKVSGFGIEPWYYYLEAAVMRPAPILGVPIMIGFVLLAIRNRKHVLLWSIVPFFLVHSLIGHKEVRFLYPLVYLMPFLILTFIQWIGQWKWSKVVNSLMVIGNIGLLLFVIFSPADKRIGLYRSISESPATKVWTPIDDPFYRAEHLKVSYYYPKDKEVERYSEIPVDRWRSGELVVSRKEIVHPELSEQYSNFPTWVVEHLNFNNWVSRTPRLFVYEVN